MSHGPAVNHCISAVVKHVVSCGASPEMMHGLQMAFSRVNRTALWSLERRLAPYGDVTECLFIFKHDDVWNKGNVHMLISA